MSDSTINELARWIRGVLVRGPIERLELCQVRTNNRDAMVAKFSCKPPEEGGASNTFFQSIAENIYNEMSDDAETFRGPTKYVVRAYDTPDGEPTARKILRIEGGKSMSLAKAEYGEGVEETEEANSHGLIAMAMRHAEFGIKNSGLATGQILRYYQEALLEAHRENKELRTHHATIRAREDEMNKLEHERSIEILEYQKQERRAELLGKQIEAFVPIIVKRLVGGKDAALAEGINTLMVKKLMRSLSEDPERMMKIMGNLNADEQALVGSLLENEATPEEKKEADKAKSAPNGSVS